MSRQLTAKHFAAGLVAAGLGAAAPAHASLFSGDTLDLVANILSWIVLFAAPVIAIGVFWIVHILPEKIAEQRHHPQAHAIKTLCLLSLFFGGLLWPLAWLWAYSKPVLYKMAYGVDTVKPGEDAVHAPAEPPPQPTLTPTAPELEESVGDAAAAPTMPPRAARAAARDRRPWET
jgi:CBS domain containing-hemolysin-like protein